jgi:hypothetical protein
VETYGSIIFILVGCLEILLRKQSAVLIAKGMLQKYTDADLRKYEKLSVVLGILSILVGILSIVGIIG